MLLVVEKDEEEVELYQTRVNLLFKLKFQWTRPFGIWKETQFKCEVKIVPFHSDQLIKCHELEITMLI